MKGADCWKGAWAQARARLLTRELAGRGGLFFDGSDGDGAAIELAVYGDGLTRIGTEFFGVGDLIYRCSDDEHSGRTHAYALLGASGVVWFGSFGDIAGAHGV